MATTHEPNGTVAAVAGRRIDAPEASSPRFPLERVEAVRQALRTQLIETGAVAVVASAACGADLLALEEAERLGLRRRIVLPFPPERFRASSVVDRPGDWGPIFDRQIAAAAATGDLVVLDSSNGDHDALYAAANAAIVHEAQALARDISGQCAHPLAAVAIIAWEGAPRGEGDLTEAFRQTAVRAGFETRVMLTQ